MSAAAPKKRAPRLTIPPGEVTKSQLETLIGYSSKQITRWVQETDIPHRRQENELYFPWPSVRGWLHRYLEEKGKRAAEPVTKTNARDRREMVEAIQAELELAKACDLIMLVEDGERWFADACARVRAKLINLPARVADAAFGAPSVLETEQRVQPLVDEVLAELRRTDDIDEEEPAEEDEPAAAEGEPRE